MSDKFLPDDDAEDDVLSVEFLDEEATAEELDDDLPVASAGTQGISIDGSSDGSDNADGAIAVDALLDAIPSSDGDPSGIDALSHKLAELNSALAVSDDEIEDDDDLAADGGQRLDLETTNYDIGAVSLEDPVRMYLREIGRVPLLNAQREVELASAMERGEYLSAKQSQLTSDFGEAPAADVLGRAIYHSFRQGWPHVHAMYVGVHGDERLPAKSLMLKRVLPVTQLPERGSRRGLRLAQVGRRRTRRIDAGAQRRVGIAAAGGPEPDSRGRGVARGFRGRSDLPRPRQTVCRSAGTSRSARAPGQGRADRGESPPGRVGGQEVRRAGHVDARSDPGRQPGLIRAVEKFQHHKGFKFSHLCHLVDPPGDHPGDRRSGPHDPHSGAYGRNDQPPDPHLAPAAAGAGPRADLGRDRRRDGDARRNACARS